MIQQAHFTPEPAQAIAGNVTKSHEKSQFDRASHCRRIASKGGRTTVERYGRGHMSRIGRRGWKVTTARYFLHDSLLHKRWLALAGAYQYWRASGLPMRRDKSGRPVWPTEPPVHPAQTTARGQLSLFEYRPPLPF